MLKRVSIIIYHVTEIENLVPLEKITSNVTAILEIEINDSNPICNL